MVVRTVKPTGVPATATWFAQMALVSEVTSSLL